MRRSPAKRSAKPAKARAKMNPRNDARREKEFARAYGSAARVLFVAELPCVVCGKRPSQNAHTRTGGAGRKADAHTIIPLCKPDHAELHQYGVRTFELRYLVDLDEAAQRTEAAWTARQAATGVA